MQEKISFALLLLMLLGWGIVTAQNQQFVWKGKIYSAEGAPISYATVELVNEGPQELFQSNEKGELSIDWPMVNPQDSVEVRNIAYQTKRFSIEELLEINVIHLQEKQYKIKAVEVRPAKEKLMMLGNKSDFTVWSIYFNKVELAQHIPNPKLKGYIEKVRVYMDNYYDKQWKHLPFRLQLYHGRDAVGETPLIQGGVIASLNPKRKHWAEVDLSSFKINFPKEGVYVAVAPLPKQFYDSLGIDAERYTIRKHDNPRLRYLCIGVTKHTGSSLVLTPWYRDEKLGWLKYPTAHFMMKLYVRGNRTKD